MVFSKSKQRYWEEVFLTGTATALIVNACLLKLEKNLCHDLFSQWYTCLERLPCHFSCIVAQDLVSNVYEKWVFFLEKQQ